jgi:predicted nucleic acid-binding protein
MAKKTVKSVSFNLDKKEEQLIWKYVSRKKFSRYVKQLILDDMKQKQEKMAEKTRVEQPKKEKMATPNQVTFQQANVFKPFIPKSSQRDR